MDNIKIIPAEKSDREEVYRLYKSQLGREYCPWDSEYPEMRDIDNDLALGNLFVMKNSEERIIAAIAIDSDIETQLLDCWDKSLNPGGEVSRLAVAVDEQCRGYAREMIKYTMKVLKERGCKSVRMLVNVNNKKALRSYAKLNFKLVGECDMFEQHFACYEKEL